MDDFDPDHEAKVELVRDLLRIDPDMNLFEYARECPEMEAAALQVLRELAAATET